MSELKPFVARKIDDGTCEPVPCVEVYLKSEADKVIAELEYCIRDYSENEENLVIANLDMQRRERHHKYKLCLAMAEKCHALYEKYSTLAADNANWEDEDYYFARWRFFEKWHKRWLKIAEQFKEAK